LIQARRSSVPLRTARKAAAFDIIVEQLSADGNDLTASGIYQNLA